MRIDSQPRPPGRTLQGPPPRPGHAQAKKDDSFWREFGNDFREFMLYLDHEKIADAGRIIKDIGGGLKGAYKLVRDLPEKLFNLPIVRDQVDDDSKRFWTDLGETAGLAAGFTAAGGHALAGCLKIASGFRQGSLSRKLDGLVDIGTATSLAVSLAGLAAARLVVAPIASSINGVRGVFNVVSGYKQHDERKQLQGALDVTRSIGSIGRLFRSRSPVLKAVGIAFAPIAGILQAGRGVRDIATGLKNDDKKKMVRGMADVATAVGTALAFASGAAVIPGVVLAVAANVVKVAYQLSPQVRARVDRGLEKLEPKLQKVVDGVDRLTEPVERVWKKLLGKWIRRVDAQAPERFSPAQLQAITALMHSDGQYSREENRRIRTVLEEAGQRKDIPKLTGAAPELAGVGSRLGRELDSAAQRREFLGFLLVVADYDYTISPEEIALLRGLSEELAVPAADFESMLRERQERSRLRSLQAKDSRFSNPAASAGERKASLHSVA